MEDLHQGVRYAPSCDEECVARFCHFLNTKFGAQLRLNGLHWLAAMLSEQEPSSHWYGKDEDDA